MFFLHFVKYLLRNALHILKCLSFTLPAVVSIILGLFSLVSLPPPVQGGAKVGLQLRVRETVLISVLSFIKHCIVSQTTVKLPFLHPVGPYTYSDT